MRRIFFMAKVPHVAVKQSRKRARQIADIISWQGDSNLIERLVKKYARRLQCSIRLIRKNSLVLSQFCGSIHIVLHLRQAYCQIRFVPLSANGGTKTFFFPTNCIHSTFLNPACSTGYPAASVSDTKVRDPEIFINCWTSIVFYYLVIPSSDLLWLLEGNIFTFRYQNQFLEQRHRVLQRYSLIY